MRACPSSGASRLFGAGGSTILLTIVMISPLFLGRLARAWQQTSTAFHPRPLAALAVKRFATNKGTQLFSSLDEDRQGRRIRKRPEANNDDWSPRSGGGGGGSWDDNNDDGWGAPSPKPSRGGRNTKDNTNDDWGAPMSNRKAPPRGRNDDRTNDDDGGWDANYTPRPRASRQGGGGSSQRGGSWGQKDNRGGRSGSSNFSPRGGRGGRQDDGPQFQKSKKPGVRAINMNHLEGAGFVHLYGLSSVLNALQANRRDLVTVQDRAAQLLDEEEAEGEYSSTEREPPKPQAQFRPYLFVQERKGTSRRGQKASDAERLLALAEERNVPVAEVDKGILNTLSGNRPHQGFVLRCGKLYFESLSRIPVPDDSAEEETPSLWLVLDEVVDPQNLGALLRSAYFLGQKKLGILVCSKNSAPPTPVVSAASAGALELVSVYSTNNLPRTLNQARDDGFRIIGASSSVPNSSGSSEFDDESEDAPPPLFDLSDLPVSHEEDDRPVLLVLGSEGHGLRTLVAKACTEFVRIPSGGQASSEDEEDGEGVDSLNVSVTGGILLWQLLSGRK